jgi:hypothetical protein
LAQSVQDTQLSKAERARPPAFQPGTKSRNVHADKNEVGDTTVEQLLLEQQPRCLGCRLDPKRDRRLAELGQHVLFGREVDRIAWGVAKVVRGVGSLEREDSLKASNRVRSPAQRDSREYSNELLDLLHPAILALSRRPAGTKFKRRRDSVQLLERGAPV